MAEDKVSISSYIAAEGGPMEFDEGDMDDVEELLAIVAEGEDIPASRSEAVRQALTCYLGVLEAFAEDGSLDDVPTNMQLKHFARQMARTELERLDEQFGRA